MNLLQKFKQYILKENLFSTKDRVLVAVSGGVDSVVLGHLCKAANVNFSMAHCNFQLRNEESHGDENFVKDFAKQLNVPLHTKRFDTERFATENKLSIQVAARELRYHWFNELLQTNNGDQVLANSKSPPGGWGGFGFVLTAHHANDNIETILMNFFKGTGINGLKGILPKHKNVIRPLLFATKEEILQYANEHKIIFREDSSNSSDKYTRNFFRNQLIPEIEKVFPQVNENLAHNADRFRDINIIYKSAIEKIKKSLIVIKGNEWHLPVLKLQKTPALHTVLYEILKDVNFTAAQVEEVIKLLNSESGKYVQSQTHRILHDRKWLIISPLQSADNAFYLIEENDTEVSFGDKKIIIKKHKDVEKIDPSPNIAQLALADITFPLLLRKWKQGDYFYPLGMQKKKKLSRFFIDQKLSLIDKENAWVIESNKKIIWVVGHRIDDRFKLKNETTSVIKLTVLPS